MIRIRLGGNEDDNDKTLSLLRKALPVCEWGRFVLACVNGLADKVQADAAWLDVYVAQREDILLKLAGRG